MFFSMAAFFSFSAFRVLLIETSKIKISKASKYLASVKFLRTLKPAPGLKGYVLAWRSVMVSGLLLICVMCLGKDLHWNSQLFSVYHFQLGGWCRNVTLRSGAKSAMLVAGIWHLWLALVLILLLGSGFTSARLRQFHYEPRHIIYL